MKKLPENQSISHTPNSSTIKELIRLILYLSYMLWQESELTHAQTTQTRTHACTQNTPARPLGMKMLKKWGPWSHYIWLATLRHESLRGPIRHSLRPSIWATLSDRLPNSPFTRHPKRFWERFCNLSRNGIKVRIHTEHCKPFIPATLKRHNWQTWSTGTFVLVVSFPCHFSC